MTASKATRKTRIVGVDPQDFSPSLLRVQSQPPAPFARTLLRLLLILLFVLILWAAFGALIDLKAQKLIANGVKHALSPGMQVTAEITLAPAPFEYLLSPVTGAFQEAGRER